MFLHGTFIIIRLTVNVRNAQSLLDTIICIQVEINCEAPIRRFFLQFDTIDLELNSL